MAFALTGTQKLGAILITLAASYSGSSWLGYQYTWRALEGPSRDTVWYMTKGSILETAGLQKIMIFGEPAWYTELKETRASRPKTTAAVAEANFKIFVFPFPALALLLSTAGIGFFVRTSIFKEKKNG
jgi:hypothetical protein